MENQAMRSSTIMALIQRLMSDRRGNVAIMFVLFLIPLIFCAGAALDYARALQFRTVLQGATDAAALAGAIEYVNDSDGSTAVGVATNYMNHTINNMPPGASGSFTVTPGTTTSNGNTYATVTVAVTAHVPTTLMALAVPSMTVSTISTAADECGSRGCGSAGSASTSTFNSSSSGSGYTSAGSSSSSSSGSGSSGNNNSNNSNNNSSGSSGNSNNNNNNNNSGGGSSGSSGSSSSNNNNNGNNNNSGGSSGGSSSSGSGGSSGSSSSGSSGSGSVTLTN